ncbi:MAG: 2-methylcitrate synthase [Pseudomonadota bacterium]
MVDKKLGGAGLRGQSAGETRLCTVGQSGTGLTYCGYDIADLAAQATFEEVVWLLHHDELPTQTQLSAYREHLQSMQELPRRLLEVLERIPPEAHPMDVMRTGCSMLGNLEPELSFQDQHAVTDRLLAAFPGIITYWWRYAQHGERIDTRSEQPTIAGHFLHLLTGQPPSAMHQRVMDVSLILYAEHEFNASTFTARVCASTLSDMHSCVTGAIGSLRGPLHGGANEAAMALIERFDSPEQAVDEVKGMLERKEKIMGFGHAVYREFDPRNPIIKDWSEKLAKGSPEREQMFHVADAIAKLMWDEKKLFPNADFFHAPSYHFLGIPTPLFTPIFVCSRTSGWTAHVIEQRANNRIIRPSADYTGAEARAYTPIEQRG